MRLPNSKIKPCIIILKAHIWNKYHLESPLYFLSGGEKRRKKKKKGRKLLWQKSCFSLWLSRKEDIITRKNAQILTVQWSQHFQAEKVRKDWPNRTDRSRLILFCLSSLSFEGDEDNEPSYIDPEGKPLKLTWITVFVYIQWLLAASKAWFPVEQFKSAFSFLIPCIYSKSGSGVFWVFGSFFERKFLLHIFSSKGFAPHELTEQAVYNPSVHAPWALAGASGDMALGLSWEAWVLDWGLGKSACSGLWPSHYLRDSSHRGDYGNGHKLRPSLTVC